MDRPKRISQSRVSEPQMDENEIIIFYDRICEWNINSKSFCKRLVKDRVIQFG
jgi:predicted DCC family thiol-disulfide oxidoreductase YuxK